MLLFFYTLEVLIKICALLHARLATVLGFTRPLIALLDPPVLLLVPDFLVLLSKLDALVVALGKMLALITYTRR